MSQHGLASDALLPRAFHELLLVAPREATVALEDELATATRRLARHLAEAGAFEAPY